LPPTGPDDGGWEDEEAMMLGRGNDEEGEEELELSLNRAVPTDVRT
jgi:hypothetical protein